MTVLLSFTVPLPLLVVGRKKMPVEPVTAIAVLTLVDSGLKYVPDKPRKSFQP
jgi:hypothetical protein